MKTQKLAASFGCEILDVDLNEVTARHLYPEIRQAFEEHSLLLFRRQNIDDDAHTELAKLFGPLENRPAMAAGKDIAFEVPAISNETKDGVADKESLHLANLKGNMLWHTDSTFLPIPALMNILTAKIVPSSGGETEVASTRAAWAKMPKHLKSVFENAIIWHRLANSRRKISAELGALPEMNQWPDRPWRAVWPNPVTGEPALYIASHAFAIEGYGLEEGAALIDEAIEFCTQPEFVYAHSWEVGDVLIWDERATLHRGMPWPYEEARTLKGICSSVVESDGLASVRLV